MPSHNRRIGDSIISANLTIYVATNGSDSTGDGSSAKPFATPGKAFDYLGGCSIDRGIDVTISIGAGDYNLPSQLVFSHPDGQRVTITGAALTGNPITGVNKTADWTVDPQDPDIAQSDPDKLANTAGALAAPFVVGQSTADRRTAQRNAIVADRAANETLLRSRFATRLIGADGMRISSDLYRLTNILFIGDNTDAGTSTAPDQRGGLFIYGNIRFGGEIAVLGFGLVGMSVLGGYVAFDKVIVADCYNQPDASGGATGVVCRQGVFYPYQLFIQGCGSAGIQVQSGVVAPRAKSESEDSGTMEISGCLSHGLVCTFGGSTNFGADHALDIYGNLGNGIYIVNGSFAFSAGASPLLLRGNVLSGLMAGLAGGIGASAVSASGAITPPEFEIHSHFNAPAVYAANGGLISAIGLTVTNGGTVLNCEEAGQITLADLTVTKTSAYLAHAQTNSRVQVRGTVTMDAWDPAAYVNGAQVGSGAAGLNGIKANPFSEILFDDDSGSIAAYAASYGDKVVPALNTTGTKGEGVYTY